jgi:hypothetical protein
MEIASQWSQFAKIKFSHTTVRANSQIRCAFAGTGHWSYIGPEAEGIQGQTMNLQFRAFYGIGVDGFGRYRKC